jgi:hypothetical protein
VGDSGLGKSALLYQAAISVACGEPFLDKKVRQGRVLVMDGENGIGQVAVMVGRLSAHLGLDSPPDDLLLWNLNDSPAHGNSLDFLTKVIKEIQPTWVIIDPINSLFNDIEKDAMTATKYYQDIRGLMSKYQCAFSGVHHVRKGSDDPKEKPESLETADLTSWFTRARGSRVLINGSDVRIGLDKPGQPNCALVMRGFERVNGEIPPILISRQLDVEGVPIGYKRASGPELLKNLGHREAYRHLPRWFRFTDAKRILDKGDSATANFLTACESAGLIRKVGAGGYEKLAVETLAGEQVVLVGPAGFIEAA